MNEKGEVLWILAANVRHADSTWRTRAIELLLAVYFRVAVGSGEFRLHYCLPFSTLIQLYTEPSIPASFDIPLARATKSLGVAEYQEALNTLYEDFRTAPDERKGISIYASTVMLHNAPEGTSMLMRRKNILAYTCCRNLQGITGPHIGDACFIQ
jgi:hypothetical protein